MVLPWKQLICSLIYSSFLGEGAGRGRRERGCGDWGKKKNEGRDRGNEISRVFFFFNTSEFWGVKMWGWLVGGTDRQEGI